MICVIDEMIIGIFFVAVVSRRFVFMCGPVRPSVVVS